MDIQLLTSLAKAQTHTPHVSREGAIQALSALKTREAAKVLVELLDDEAVAEKAYDALSSNVYIFDAFYQVVSKHQSSNTWATHLLKAWAKKKWLMQRPALPEALKVVIYKIPDTITAEMLSPSEAAWSRSDIALHAESLLKNALPDAIEEIKTLKAKGYPIAFVADHIDTQKARPPQRESALEALLWHIEGSWGAPYEEPKGIVLSQYVDDAFYALFENRGTLLLAVDTAQLKTKEVITILPYQDHILLQKNKTIHFQTKNPAWQSIWRIGSRTAFLLGHTLSYKAKAALGETLLSSESTSPPRKTTTGYTLSQKLIGKACGLQGVHPGELCKPVLSTFALSQSDTDSKEAPGYSSDLTVAQHFGITQPSSEHVLLKANDGKIHTWLNRLLLPDSTNVSCDSYIRSAFGISLSSASYQADEIALTGCLPIKMPHSFLVKFQGQKHSDIRLRDLIHAIPYFGLTQGFFTEEEHSAFNHSILEIEGLESFSAEEAYEFTESTAAYKTYACTFQLDLERVMQAVKRNIEWLEQLIPTRYSEHDSLQRRLSAMKAWLLNPHLLQRDSHAHYEKTLEIQLENIQEPLLANLKNPTQVFKLSELSPSATFVDEVWVGSTAIHLDHYRVVADILKAHTTPLKTRLWLAPPSPLELHALMQEGHYNTYGQAGVYTEMPEDALCTQSRFKPGACIVTTSLRTFSERQHALFNGYITSPEIATLTAILGRLPTLSEYRAMIQASIS